MALRVGILTCAHLHLDSYVACLGQHPDAEVVGLWDDASGDGVAYAENKKIPFFANMDDLFALCDAVVIVSENARHAELAIAAANAGKHILCEKPLVISEEEGQAVLAAAAKANIRLMTAFPCRFAPSWPKLKERVQEGAIGTIRAICATNRGTCPFGWFVEPAKSGGGAMIDHVVHVADLLRDLLGHEPLRVQAQIGNNMYGQEWDDTAMVTLEYPDGVFATLDSSWSRPKGYYTWGDVTMKVIGDNGVIELDMFGSHVDATSANGFGIRGYGNNPDAGMVNEFVRACLDDREPTVTGEHGLAAARVALAGYRSVQMGEPVSVN